MPIVRVVKRGKGSKTLNQKSKKIAEYIGKKIQFENFFENLSLCLKFIINKMNT